MGPRICTASPLEAARYLSPDSLLQSFAWFDTPKVLVQTHCHYNTVLCTATRIRDGKVSQKYTFHEPSKAYLLYIHSSCQHMPFIPLIQHMLNEFSQDATLLTNLLCSDSFRLFREALINMLSLHVLARSHSRFWRRACRPAPCGVPKAMSKLPTVDVITY